MPQITGKFVNMLPCVEGEKDGRAWVRTQFAIMTMDSNPKLVAFDCFGWDKVELVKNLQPSQTVIVDYVPESREFNDRFFTNLNMIRMQIAVPMQAAGSPSAMPNPQNVATASPQMPDAGNGDMFGEGGMI